MVPFVQQNSQTFTRANIEVITPGQMGVYGIFKTNRWIYVGRGDIRNRLLAHFNGDNTCITGELPTHYVDEVTTSYIQRETDLIRELTPACNQRVG